MSMGQPWPASFGPPMMKSSGMKTSLPRVGPLCQAALSGKWRRPVSTPGWLAGTSAPAPALAAALALASQDLDRREARSPRFGLLAPLAGLLARTGDGGVHDVTEGSNGVLGLPCCDAGPGYDLTSGWGSVRLPELVDLAGERAR